MIEIKTQNVSNSPATATTYRDVGNEREQGRGSVAYRDVGNEREQGRGSVAYRDVGNEREQGRGSVAYVLQRGDRSFSTQVDRP
ncbi:MAG: hypothetical protein OEQ39_14545 [Gammaproteobacteria bacterium]|nr:hypothetical protein [Gammaproteobacteria bacterium]